MRSTLNACMMVFLWVVLAAPVHAGENPAREVARNCRTELATHCQDVTPGRGRVLACLHAYSDKISGQCRDAVAEAREQVELLMAAIRFVQSECGADAERLCKDVVPGEGRVLHCLEENEEQISGKCKLALEDVGLKD